MAGSEGLSLVVIESEFSVCRLEPDAEIPTWVGGALVSVTRTANELSIVVESDRVPDGVRCEGGWRCLRVKGVLDFGEVGVLASLLEPLARAGVSVFVFSTFDTDYLMVKVDLLGAAAEALRSVGHRVGGMG